VPTFERIFRLPGGDTHIACSPDRVEVLSKTPKPGYTATVQQYGDASLRVSFTSDRHTSRVFVSWRDECYSEVSESV